MCQTLQKMTEVGPGVNCDIAIMMVIGKLE